MPRSKAPQHHLTWVSAQSGAGAVSAATSRRLRTPYALSYQLPTDLGQLHRSGGVHCTLDEVCGMGNRDLSGERLGSECVMKGDNRVMSWAMKTSCNLSSPTSNPAHLLNERRFFPLWGGMKFVRVSTI